MGRLARQITILPREALFLRFTSLDADCLGVALIPKRSRGRVGPLVGPVLFLQDEEIASPAPGCDGEVGRAASTAVSSD
ncbi:hypothetical protein CP980_08225 [Streptomyces vinaceus]|uniref:Uncharacterized protein n=1 Tax=Streptomyces vinaceus TaxID=1960 RepID=A0A5J6J1D9_STRVI|nr:hypothetical protein CP980_08225 [Streptomyces vinaceus]